MEKAKNIILSHKVIRMVLWAAGILAVVAVVAVLVFSGRGEKGANETPVLPDNTVVVNVMSGDTLSKILSAQGFGGADINKIADILKTKAGITGLRADRDKIEFTRDGGPNTPVSKITVLPGPWRRVELTCDDGGVWNCNAIDIERDTRLVYRQGEI